jgi:hypothetical protein
MAPKVGATVKRPRNVHVEALRLVAIFCIAVFQTFVPWFNGLAYNADTGADVTGLAQSSFALFLLGIISLLGTFGNHIFFMISGFYLIPRMANDSVVPGYWKRQYLSVARRVVVIVSSVALYALVALVVDYWWDIPGISWDSGSWLLGSLGFVWIYVAVIALAPLFAWVQRHWRAWPVALVMSFLAMEFANCAIAFFTPGDLDRSIFDWRSFVGAVTYLVGFLLAGLVGARWEYFERLGGSLLFGSVFMSIVLEGSLALSRDTELLGAVSYKSTSIVPFFIAGGALICVMSKEREKVLPGVEPKKVRIIRWLASGILGFYVVQALLTSAWASAMVPLLGGLLGQASTDTLAYSFGNVVLFVVLGVLLSCAFAFGGLVIDRFVRHPLLRALKLR